MSCADEGVGVAPEEVKKEERGKKKGELKIERQHIAHVGFSRCAMPKAKNTDRKHAHP